MNCQNAHEARTQTPSPRYLAFTRGSVKQRLVLPHRIANWSLTGLRQRLVKAGASVLRHAPYYCLAAAREAI